MAYEGFTLDLLVQRFALSVVQHKDLFAHVEPYKASDLLNAVLKRNLLPNGGLRRRESQGLHHGPIDGYGAVTGGAILKKTDLTCQNLDAE